MVKNTIENVKKQTEAITLIALIVTIVILLILAGISIGMLSGDNSIINQAEKAKIQAEIEQEKEVLNQATVSAMSKNRYGNVEKVYLDKELDKTLGNDKYTSKSTRKGIKVTFTSSNRGYLIDIDGNVEKDEAVVETAKFVDGLVNKTHGFGNSTAITKIERATAEPNEQYKQETNIVSTEDSDFPIYMWSENNILYWYSKVQYPELPSNCSQIFAGFSMLQDASGIEDWSTENVTDMSLMFADCRSLSTLKISEWDTTNVTNMNAMFAACISIDTIDLSGWDTSNVTNMSVMFANGNITSYGNPLSSLEKIIVSDKFVVDNVTESSGMFGNCIHLIGGNGSIYDSSKTDKSMAHIDIPGNPGYFSAN